MALNTQKFNWSGISDNGDGSYTAVNKRAHRRLLKEFHRQGFQVRSNKIPGEGYRIRAIGTKQLKSGYPIRRIPVQRRGIRRGITPRYHQYRSSPPRLRGPSMLGKAGSWALRKRKESMIRKQQDQEKEIQFKKTEAELNEKLKKERIIEERAETVQKLEKQELNRVRLQHEKTQIANRMRDNMAVKQDWHSPAPAPVKSSDIKSSDMQGARESYIKGGGGSENAE